MFPRSIYLRDQADKCRGHAGEIGNAEMQIELRKLAAEYVVRAEEIENQEKKRVRPPRLATLIMINVPCHLTIIVRNSRRRVNRGVRLCSLL